MPAVLPSLAVLPKAPYLTPRPSRPLTIPVANPVGSKHGLVHTVPRQGGRDPGGPRGGRGGQRLTSLHLEYSKSFPKQDKLQNKSNTNKKKKTTFYPSFTPGHIRLATWRSFLSAPGGIQLENPEWRERGRISDAQLPRLLLLKISRLLRLPAGRSATCYYI